MQLSQQQIKFFEQNGYVGPFTLFSPTQAKEYLDIIQKKRFSEQPLFFRTHETHFNRFSLRCEDMHFYNKKVFELTTNNTILQKIVSLRGENIILLRSVFWNKPPNTCLIPWHKDILQGLFSEKPTFISVVSCWLALEEVTENSGCLEVLPGSHHEDLTRHEIYSCKDFVQKSVVSPNLLPPKQIDAARIVQFPLQAGQFVLFDQRILHGSGPNLSTKNRQAFVIRYAPADITPRLKTKCILVRGHDKGCKQKIVSPPKNVLQCTWRKYLGRVIN